MKKFMFSLEKVLEVKRIEEKTIQKQLLFVQAKIYEVEQNILALTEKITLEREILSSSQNEKKNSNSIMLHYNYIESLSVEKENFYLDLDNLKHTETSIRVKLVEKSKERRALEKLRESKLQEYRKEYNKEQQILYNEISLNSHRLKQGATS